MTDQISILISEPTVAAGSAVTAAVNFRTRSTASASIPTSIRYRVDCLTTGRQVINDTSVTAASSASIAIPGTSNGTIDSSNDFETRQITVIADYGLPTQVKAAATWRVRTIRNYAFPHTPIDDQFLEPYYPITPAEVSAGVTPTSYQYEPGDVRRYGADPTGVASSTTAINAALSVNATVYFYAGTYLANNLTQTHDYQLISASGEVRIVKNANGALFTSDGDGVEVNGIGFRGDASSPTFTGDGLVMNGIGARVIRCGSRWMSGRALVIAQGHHEVLDHCDIYQTTGATASDFDIDVGTSGTASLYGIIQNVRTSQSTGGFRFTDCGSQRVIGCQFGKLSVLAGTSPGGTNGGIYQANRITGTTTVNVSNAVIMGNQFGAVAITFGAATSGCIFFNEVDSGHTVTNNGNANNFILRQVSTGSTINLQFGDDTSAAILEIVPTAAGSFEFNKTVRMKNAQALIFEGTGGTNASFNESASDNLEITNSVSAKGILFTQAGAGTVNYDINGARSMQIDSNNTAGNTRFLIYDVDNATLERVTVGAADSGGVGFKTLRIPN